jgi:hypothetical protein
VHDVGTGISTEVYDTSGGRYIDILTVPEPSSFALIAVGGLV